MNIGLLGPTYAGRSTNILGNRCVNWIPELNPQDSKGPLTFFGSPGSDLWATIPILLYPSASPVRAMRVFNNYLWLVAGDTLFRIDPYGTMTYILTLVTSSGPVHMKDNGVASLGVGGNQLIIIDQANVWIYNVVTLTVNSLSTSPSVLSHIEFIDGYIIGTEPGTMRYRVSDLYDAYTSYSGAGQWGALSFASVESSSDPLMGVVSVHEQVYFLKHFSTEIWYNTGTPTSAGSPFTRLPGGVLDVGTISTASIAKGAQTFFFLGQQRSGDTSALVGIYMMNGYTPDPHISTFHQLLHIHVSHHFGRLRVLHNHRRSHLLRYNFPHRRFHFRL